jgi:hypothetical protein
VVTRLVVNESPQNRRRENRGGSAVLAKLGGENQGLPYFAFLDRNGKLIVNSRRDSQGNIGYPSQPEELAWFLKMLRQAAPGLSAGDAGIIEDSLRNQKR